MKKTLLLFLLLLLLSGVATFLTLFDRVPYKYVATATPNPNRTKELIHYAGFLGIMDTGQALTRFFKRDSSSAGNLQLHPHKEREFWLWVSTWATFLQKPSDLGYSDEGYDLSDLNLHWHRLPVDHLSAGFDSWGQGKLLRDAAASLRDASREKRDSIMARVAKCLEIVQQGGENRHWVIWHDLEDERRAIEKAIPDAVSIYGTMDLEDREEKVALFSDGKIEILASKPVLTGSGCNFQRHCHSAIYVGLTGYGHKFNDFIQSVKRLHRFLQTKSVDIHIIYTESEDSGRDSLMRKWKEHDETVGRMSDIIREYGLSHAGQLAEQRRSIGVTRQEVKSGRFTAVNYDNILEMQNMANNSVDLIISSWPFSDHYEYTESYHDFGHNDGDLGFFEQMEFLTPHCKRVLAPGRMYCIHVKDRLLYGSVTKLGMYSVNPFSDKCVAHLIKHGLIYCGRITIVTDVVRENGQTYRLGWTENSKDGTKMGVGSPEYILLFRKLQTDQTKAYADVPVKKLKEKYTRARWQFDASPFWRSNGNRFFTPQEAADLVASRNDGIEVLRKLWHQHNGTHIYDFEEHVALAKGLEDHGFLPADFMALDPVSHSNWVWDDVTRMRTLNTDAARGRIEGHICPLQLDVVERLIERYSNPGETVFDPFAGLFTVPYVAIQMRRKGYGIELSAPYFRDGVRYCREAEQKVEAPTLFDLIGDDLADPAPVVQDLQPAAVERKSAER